MSQALVSGCLQVYSKVNSLTRTVANHGLAALQLPPIEHYEALAKVKLITAIFVCIKHFLINLLIWFPMDFEAQKSLMLYLILPPNGGLFQSFAAALNPGGFGLKALSDPLCFLKGAGEMVPTSAGHAALNLATDAWAETLKTSKLALNVEEQKRLLASITQPLPIYPLESLPLLTDPLKLLDLSKHSPIDLSKVPSPLDLAKGGLDLSKTVNPLDLAKFPGSVTAGLGGITGNLPGAGDLPLPKIPTALPGGINLPKNSDTLPDSMHLPKIPTTFTDGLHLPNVPTALPDAIHLPKFSSALPSPIPGLTGSGSSSDSIKLPLDIPTDKPLGHFQLLHGLAQLQQKKEDQTKNTLPSPASASETLKKISPLPKPELPTGFFKKGTNLF